MKTILQRAVDVVRDDPAPALRLDELRRRVRGSGVAVSEEALLHALRRGREHFRLVDPWRGAWRGAWSTLGRPRRAARRSRSGERWSPDGAGRSREGEDPGGVVGSPWVVGPVDGGGAAEDSPTLRRLRGSLAHLGWAVDDASPMATARWCRHLGEAARLRRRIRRAGGRSGPTPAASTSGTSTSAASTSAESTPSESTTS